MKWMNNYMNDEMIEWTNKWMNKCMGCVSEWINYQKNGWMKSGNWREGYQYGNKYPYKRDLKRFQQVILFLWSFQVVLSASLCCHIFIQVTL